MFTGIVQQLGKIGFLSNNQIGVRVNFAHTDIGESIAVNGACLTLKKVNSARNMFYFDVMAETLKTTNLGFLKLNDLVNLERALKLGDSVGGHFMSGHIDETGQISKILLKPNACLVEIKVSQPNLKYIIPKGSIGLDGISLTIVAKTNEGFTVSLIALTRKETTLGFKKAGDIVNIEYDQMVKNTVNFLENKLGKKNNLTKKYLEEKGML